MNISFQKFFNIFLISVIVFLSANCTNKSDETVIKSKIESLAKDLSFEKNLVPIRQVLKTKKIIEKYFHRDVQFQLQIRQTQFKIKNAQDLAQNLFLLNKMVGKLSLEFQGIKITKMNDESGSYYVADLNIDAIGEDAQGNQKIDEEIDFQFFVKKVKSDWLIFKGRNPLKDE